MSEIRIHYFVVFVCSLLLIYPSSDAEAQILDKPDSAEVARLAVHTIYQPAYEDLANSLAEWNQKTTGLCERPTASAIFQLQRSFAKVTESFSRLELYKFGPMVEQNRQYRLFFWPDRRGVGAKHLQRLLAGIPESEAGQLDIAGKSVAVQGLSALERLLFDVKNLPAESAPQCHLIPAIVENLFMLTSNMHKEWQTDTPFVQAMLNPSKDTVPFRTGDEVLRSILTQIKVGLDVIMNHKIYPLISGDVKAQKSAPLWLSQRTGANLAGNILSIEALLLDTGLVMDEKLHEELRFEFNYLNNLTAKIKRVALFTDDNGKIQEEYFLLFRRLFAVVSSIHFTVSNQLAEDLGLSIGFNSEDGD